MQFKMPSLIFIDAHGQFIYGRPNNDPVLNLAGPIHGHQQFAEGHNTTTQALLETGWIRVVPNGVFAMFELHRLTDIEVHHICGALKELSLYDQAEITIEEWSTRRTFVFTADQLLSADQQPDGLSTLLALRGRQDAVFS